MKLDDEYCFAVRNAKQTVVLIEMTEMNGFVCSSKFVYQVGNTILYSFSAKIPNILQDGWIAIGKVSDKYIMRNNTSSAMLYTNLGDVPIVRDFNASEQFFKVFLLKADSGKTFRIHGVSPLLTDNNYSL